MSNVIQFRKIPEIDYSIVTGSDYGSSHYMISLMRFPDGEDKILINILCRAYEEISVIRDQALQEVSKGYAAICSGKNIYEWKIHMMPDMKKS